MRKKMKFCIAFIAFFALISYSDAKGGRGGGSRGSFSRGSSSRGSSSWFGSSSRSSPSHSSHSSPSYTHSAPSYTHSSPSSSYGWNVGSSKHSGPPPSYPGLQNRPVPSHNNPPAYSPYSPTYSYPSSNYRNFKSYEKNNHFYGNTFGRQGLAGNTYISNNYYGSHRSSDSGFLTNAMFYGAGMHHGNSWGRSSYYNHHNHGYGRRTWSEDEDRKWRETTRAPYFENKVPGEEKILPASAVIGVATAFGLASLLPLNVPSNKPLMYCNNTELIQSQVKINNEYIYQCINGSIMISCLKVSNDKKSQKIQVNQSETDVIFEEIKGNHTEVLNNLTNLNQTGQIVTQKANQTEVNNNMLNSNQTEQLANQTSSENQTNITIDQFNHHKNQADQDCSSKVMECNLPDEEVSSSFYCKDDTLLSKSEIFCNSTTILNETIQVNGTDVNTTITILNCYEGQIPEKQASFIPIRTTTQRPTTTTERSLSYSARAHLFLLKLLGKYDLTEIKSTTSNPLQQDNEMWIPEALTFPPTTTTVKTTTTEAPFVWMEETFTKFENGRWGVTLAPISKTLIDMIENANEFMKKRGDREGMTYPPYFKKVYITKPMETTTVTSFSSDNTTISEELSSTVSINGTLSSISTISSTTVESFKEYDSDEYDEYV